MGCVPRGDQPVGDLQHRGVVVAHRLQRERRQENVVGRVPVRLVVVRGEQPVAGHRADAFEGRCHMLGEPGLIGEFGDQIRPGHQHHLTPEEALGEDRPELPGQPHVVLHRRLTRDAHHIAHKGNSLRRVRNPSRVHTLIVPAAIASPRHLNYKIL
jgi:hypothetical protein